jgi:hypothetical protein
MRARLPEHVLVLYMCVYALWHGYVCMHAEVRSTMPFDQDIDWSTVAAHKPAVWRSCVRTVVAYTVINAVLEACS